MISTLCGRTVEMIKMIDLLMPCTLFTLLPCVYVGELLLLLSADQQQCMLIEICLVVEL